MSEWSKEADLRSAARTSAQVRTLHHPFSVRSIFLLFTEKIEIFYFIVISLIMNMFVILPNEIILKILYHYGGLEHKSALCIKEYINI